ncbi:MAG: hypothetical protein GY803_19035 [Chloroflexi bacterium]|nr:hypothetical protein [Chloroflexota bacterium]
MSPKTILFVILTSLLLIGCGGPSAEYTPGEILLSEDFSNPKAWEYYIDEAAGYSLKVSDGVYRIQTDDSGYIWGLNDQTHTDVVIEATTRQLSSYENNAYGIMCRANASNNGDGYYFLVSGDGFYSISRGEGDDVTPIVDWTDSSAVNAGTDSNTLRAVCIGDYLALYVNDKFVADARDAVYSSGYAGFAAAAFDGGDIAVTFDNLTISQASLAAE